MANPPEPTQGAARAIDRSDAAFLDAVLQALPAAAFVVDGVGNVRYATQRAGDAVGYHAEELVGESVLKFVSADTAWAYAAAVALATDYPDVTMGPLRVELVHAKGHTRTADLWATNHLDDPDIEGIVCLLSDETAAMGLSEAVAEMAQDATLGVVADRVAQAMTGQPVNALAAVLLADEGEPDNFVLHGATDLPATLIDAAAPALRATVDTGIRQLHGGLDGLSDVAREVAEHEGMAALWVEPISAAGEPPIGGIVLWRSRAGNPSPNQMRSVFQGASILGMTLGRDRLGALDSMP